MLQELDYHPNLVNYKRIKLSSSNNQYFIMDYCNGGTLTDEIKMKILYSEHELS